ncbi:exopolysaccharide biosynthesis protein [Puniceicoccus vermicola]|uniref:Exopolysaccharide biosynthesis protein n=1 Tax=Puniceicoccus vermicola TaxID=388746 RepID=A0A7X1E2V4_9BACT|nr:exopolysaccharide biosynthesis protein [Puniceicoccus vermicola]MBC2600396.1 exopolysaccharide biosynthesis protein [Puniceicoccus vermicola]
MESPEKTLSENLLSLVEGPGETISIRTMVERVGDKGFGILLIMLSLPSALPVPAPGYSTPFGIMLVLLGVQMMIGRVTPWLPEKVLRREVSRESSGKLIRSANRFLHFAEKFVRPRMRWINLRGGRIFLGSIVCCMACLMILPIPLTNTAPAMVIFLIGVALSEDDGLVAIASFALGILAAAFYVYIIYLLATVGMDGVIQLKEWIKELIFGAPEA